MDKVIKFVREDILSTIKEAGIEANCVKEQLIFAQCTKKDIFNLFSQVCDINEDQVSVIYEREDGSYCIEIVIECGQEKQERQEEEKNQLLELINSLSSSPEILYLLITNSIKKAIDNAEVYHCKMYNNTSPAQLPGYGGEVERIIEETLKEIKEELAEEIKEEQQENNEEEVDKILSELLKSPVVQDIGKILGIFKR